MPAAFVNSASATGAVSVSVTITGTTAGNGLIILIGYDSTAGVTSPAISGETVVAMGTNNNDGTLTLNLHGFVVTSLASGGSKTFTATIVQNYSCIIMEISGQDTTNFYVTGSAAWAGAQSGGTHTVNVTTTATGQFVIGFGILHNAVPTVGSGYTFPATNMPVFGTENWKAQYDTDFDSGAAGAKAFGMGNTASNFWSIKGYAFAAAAGGGAASIQPNAGGLGTGPLGGRMDYGLLTPTMVKL